MSFKQLAVRLEISFWQIVIQLLSESEFIQFAVGYVAELWPRAQHYWQRLDRERLLRWASVGFAGGFLIGLAMILIYR